MYLLAILTILAILLIYLVTRRTTKSNNTNLTDIEKESKEKIYFLSKNDIINYDNNKKIKSAYVINLTKYNNDYQTLLKDKKRLKKILKINVIDYFQQFNYKPINYSWQNLSNNMHTDFSDALLVIIFG